MGISDAFRNVELFWLVLCCLFSSAVTTDLRSTAAVPKFSHFFLFRIILLNCMINAAGVESEGVGPGYRNGRGRLGF